MNPIPEIPLIPSPRTNEAASAVGFKWADGRAGLRHKIGGTPDWIQGDATPVCQCGKVMCFYGQLDSIGDRFCIADVGIIFVFVCPDCWSTQSVIQSN